MKLSGPGIVAGIAWEAAAQSHKAKKRGQEAQQSQQQNADDWASYAITNTPGAFSPDQVQGAQQHLDRRVTELTGGATTHLNPRQFGMNGTEGSPPVAPPAPAQPKPQSSLRKKIGRFFDMSGEAQWVNGTNVNRQG